MPTNSPTQCSGWGQDGFQNRADLECRVNLPQLYGAGCSTRGLSISVRLEGGRTKASALAMSTNQIVTSLLMVLAFASGALALLNRFISAETYRAVAKPNRKTGGEAKPRLRRKMYLTSAGYLKPEFGLVVWAVKKPKQA